MNLLTLANKLAEELGEDLVAEVTALEVHGFLVENDELDAVTDALDEAAGTARDLGHEQFILIRVKP